MRTTNTILTIALAAVVILYVRSCSSSHEERHRMNQRIDALTETVSITRNNLGESETRIKAMALTSMNQLRDIQNLTGAKKGLQQLVREQKKAIAAISASTKAEIIYKTDSVLVSMDVNDNPVYFRAFADEWKWGSVRMSRDSLSLFLDVRNEFDFAIKKNRKLFGKSEYEVYAKSKNPETYVNDLAGSTLVIPEKRWHIGPSIGYGFGVQGEISIFVGVSISYGVLSF